MNLKRLTQDEYDAIQARLGPRCYSDGEMAHMKLERERPQFFAEVSTFASSQSLSTLEYSRLAIYCLERGMPEGEIVPMIRTVIWQAGAQYAAVIMHMADQWQKPPILEQILKN